LYHSGLTGFLLAVSYSPSTDSAYESVRYIQERAVFGGLVRGMHRWGANLLIIVLMIHIAQVFIWGAYKRPRRWTWVSGCLLLLIVLGLGFTGYLLPWDLKAYFGTEVGTRIAGSAPGLGPYLLTWLRGGPQLGPLTLPRFYAIHVLLLPALLVMGIAWHLWQVRTFGITPPWARVGAEREVPTAGPFFPFRLHWTCNDWERADDTDSTPTGTGAEFADIPVPPEQHAPVRFSFLWTKAGNREGRDFEVRIEPAGRIASAGPSRSVACKS
jgi:menaquinol-cytochrome c reductase cytochrome b subunit